MQSRAMARTRQGFAPLMTLPLLMGLRLSGWSLSTLTGESRCLSIQLGAHNAINYPKGRSGDASSNGESFKLFKAFLPLWQRWAVEDTEKSSEFLRKEKKKGGCWHEGSCGFPQSLLRNRKQGGEEDVMPSDWAQISLSATILSVKYIPLYKQKYPPKNEPLAWGSKITHSEQGRPRWKNTQSIFPKIYHISSLSYFFFPLLSSPWHECVSKTLGFCRCVPTPPGESTVLFSGLTSVKWSPMDLVWAGGTSNVNNKHLHGKDFQPLRGLGRISTDGPRGYCSPWFSEIIFFLVRLSTWASAQADKV